MNLADYWEKAIAHTVIVKPRVPPLETFGKTVLPYLFLAESSVNEGDTVKRKGQVHVEKPSLILPMNSPAFQGFDFEDTEGLDPNLIVNFLLVRGVSFPSLKYRNEGGSLDIVEGRLAKAIRFFSDRLEKEEDVNTTLLCGPEDCWQFSLLIFIAAQVARSAEGDMKKILEQINRKKRWF